MGDDRLQITSYKLQIINFGTGGVPYNCQLPQVRWEGREYTFSPARKYTKSRREPFVWFSGSPDDQRENPLESPVGLSRRPKGEPFGIPGGEQIVNDQLPVARCQLPQVRCGEGIYFLSGEKVCKEPPRTFRMVLGLSRRPKGEPFGIPGGGQIVNDQLPVARCQLLWVRWGFG